VLDAAPWASFSRQWVVGWSASHRCGHDRDDGSAASVRRGGGDRDDGDRDDAPSLRQGDFQFSKIGSEKPFRAGVAHRQWTATPHHRGRFLGRRTIFGTKTRRTLSLCKDYRPGRC
jgi:hypothetical protein